MKQNKERLLEVEIHEERLAELNENDWRGEHGQAPENHGHDLP